MRIRRGVRLKLRVATDHILQIRSELQCMNLSVFLFSQVHVFKEKIRTNGQGCPVRASGYKSDPLLSLGAFKLEALFLTLFFDTTV